MFIEKPKTFCAGIISENTRNIKIKKYKRAKYKDKESLELENRQF